MAFWDNYKEITITEDGDLAVGPDGDFAFSVAGDALVEHVMVRLRTYLNESPIMPGIGTQLEDFIGKPNTLETGNNIEQEVYRALLTDGLFDANVLTITAVPVSDNEISVLIEPDTSASATIGTLAFDLNLETGNLT
jgi:hypothetical protein